MPGGNSPSSAAAAPILDIDGALNFLVLENVLINNDGYWVRASDYSVYQDVQGRFHVIPYDANETFSLPGGPGIGGGPMGARGRPGFGRGSGFGGGRSNRPELDPLTGADDASKPLLSKLLAVPALRTRYLGYVRDMAEKWLDWEKLAPLAERYQSVIAAEVKADTRKLKSFEAFTPARRCRRSSTSALPKPPNSASRTKRCLPSSRSSSARRLT